MYGTIDYAPTRGAKGVGVFAITAQPHVAMRLKRVFARIQQNREGALLIAGTDEVCRDIEWAMERWPLEPNERAAARIAEGAAAHMRAEEVLGRILAGETLDSDLIRTPARGHRWPHQALNADLITTSRRLVIGDSLGAGKTHSGLSALRNPDSLPALMVTQTHLASQWKREFEATWPDLRAHVITKGTPYDPSTRRGSGGQHPDVLIGTYSKLAGWGDHLTGQIRTVVFDEVHDLRNGTLTAKGLAAGRIADAANYVVGLTGTAVVNYGDEIHSIYSIVRPDLLGTRAEFLREWCGVEFNGKAKVRDPAALGAYLRAAGAFTATHLPHTAPVRVEHTIDYDPKVFANLAGDAAAMARFILDRNTSSTDRWRASGEFDLRMRQATGIAKAPYVAAFVDMLLEQVDKIVLWGWHRAVYDVWMTALARHKPVLYTGSESASGKDRAKAAFVDGDSRVLIMSLRSGAGVDGLQEVAHTGVFGELDWSDAIHDQAIGRLDRPGQTETVVAYFLNADEGSDPSMIEVLGVKASQARPIQDPNAALTAAVDTSDRIRALARDLLARHGEPVPAEPLPAAPPDEDRHVVGGTYQPMLTSA